MSTIALTKDNFDDLVAKNEVIVLDFWAEWCGPCKAFSPTYEEVSNQYSDVIFGKVDTQTESELAADFRIRSIPTVMIIRQGVVVFSQAGTMPASALKTLIDQASSLDMDEVKKKIAESQESGQSGT